MGLLFSWEVLEEKWKNKKKPKVSKSSKVTETKRFASVNLQIL